MSLTVNCPACGETFDLREARNEQAWREFVAVLVQFPAPVQPALMQYLELFRPAQQSNVRSSTALKLASELLPLIKAQRLERNHTHYDAPSALWTKAMFYLASKRSTLQLPLKGNGYLLETIASQCEKQATKDEKQALQVKRQPLRPAESTRVDSTIPAQSVATSGGFSKLAALLRDTLDDHPNPTTGERP